MKFDFFTPEWLTDKFIYLMLAVFPLWTGFEGYSNVTFSKYLFFVISTGVWAAGTACAAVIRHRKPKMSGGAWAVLALLSAALLSALLSPYGSDVWIGAGRYDGFVSLLLYGLIFLGASFYARPKWGYAAALAFSVTFCCAVSVLQLLGFNPLKLFPSDWTYFDHGVKYSAEFLGNIGNVDVFAALLCLAVPVFFGAYVCIGGRRAAWFLIPAAFGEFIALESGVASAKLGLGASLVLGAAVLMNRERLKRLAAALLAAALAAGLAACVHFTAEGVAFGASASAGSGEGESSSYELGQMLHGHFEDSYGSGRIGIWRQLLSVYPQRPLLGGGPGTVSDRIEINYSRYVPETGSTLKTRVDNAHNEYLGYLMDDGALGFTAYAAMVVLTLIRWIRRRREADAALGCGLAGYWVQSFFGIGLCLVLPVIWLAWGLMWANNDEITVNSDE